MWKLIPYIILTFLLSGCVGAMTVFPDSHTTQSPFNRVESYTDSAGTLRSYKISTQADFLLEWGQPSSRKEIDAEHEVWTYYRGKKWCGLVIGLIIAVPLVLPICTAEDRIVFERGTAVSITVKTTDEAGIMCGPLVGGLHNGGCI